MNSAGYWLIEDPSWAASKSDVIRSLQEWRRHRDAKNPEVKAHIRMLRARVSMAREQEAKTFRRETAGRQTAANTPT